MVDRSEPPSDLTGKVTEDAVPLDAAQPPTPVESIELQPGSATVSYLRSPGGSQPSLSRAPLHQTNFQSVSTVAASSSRQTPQPFSPSHRNNREEVHESRQQPEGQVPGVSGLQLSCSPAASPSGICQAPSGQDEESSLKRDVLKGIGKAVESVISTEFPPDLSSLESSTKSLQLTPTDVDDADIEEYRDKLPKNLKVDFFDAMILYHEGNSKLVQKFLDRINTEVTLKKVDKPKVVLYDRILPDAGMSPIAQLDFVLPYCTYVFLFVTKHFCSDAWAEFSSHTCLMNAIENQESRWSVVPIFTEPKRNPTFRIPASVRSLKGIQYWSDDKFYVDSLRKLLEDKLHIRKQKEEEHKVDRKIWIRTEKGRERRKADERQRKEIKAKEQERICEQQHQQSILAKMQQTEHEQQQRHIFQIQGPKEFFDGHGYSGLISQNNQPDLYLDAAFHHHSKFADTPLESGSAQSSLDQQGMSEYPFLHQGCDDLGGPLSLPSNPSLSQLDGIASIGPGAKPSFTLDPENFQNTPKPSGSAAIQESDQSPGKSSASTVHQTETFATAVSSSTATAALCSVADHSPLQNSVNRSEPISQQPFSPEMYPGVSSPQDPHSQSLPNLSTDARLGGYNSRGNKAPLLSAIADGSKQLPDMPSVSKGEQGTVVSDEKTATSVLQQMVKSGQLHSVPARDFADGMSLAQNKDFQTKEELLQKDDLEEDIPPESPVCAGYQHPAAPQKARGGLLGQPYFHEPMIVQGPAHRGHHSAQAHPAPVQQENYPGYYPRLQNPANIGMSRNSYPMRPFNQHVPHQQYEPHQYEHPVGYPAPPGAAFTGYRQPLYGPYPQQVCPPYPSAYGGHPGYQQHPQQYCQYPAPVPFPGYYDQYYVPQPLTGQQAPIVYHNYYHKGEKVPTATINYIKNVDQLMMASTISTKTRRPQVPPDEGPESEQDQWSCSPAGYQNRPDVQTAGEEQYVSRESGNEGMSGESQEAGSGYSTLVATGSQSTGGSGRSQLTENVTFDRRSCQTSVPSDQPAQLHLTELPASAHESSEGLLSPSSPTYPPLGMRDPASGQWHQNYEQQQETGLKTYDMGPDEENS